MRDCRPRGTVLAAALLASMLVAPSSTARAQNVLGHAEDASMVPRGLLRLRAISAWTRYDHRFAPTGTAPLGAPFTADALGTAQVGELGAVESAVTAAAGAPFALSLGRARLDATGREEMVPLSLEYGITNRYSVGVVVPIVRKRVALLFRLDTTGSPANVGPNPFRTSPGSSQGTVQVQTQFAAAVSSLQSRLTFCQANPGAAGCAALLARQAEAQQLIQSSQTFAADLATIYGSANGQGSAYVPLAQSGAQVAIETRVAAFNAQYRDLLASSTDLISAVPRPAGGPAGSADFQRFLVGELGRDSLTTQERVGIGDVEIGFKARVLDVVDRRDGRLGAQLAIAGSVRLPTGSTQSPSEVVDMRLGGGVPVLDGRLLFDARARRLGLFASARVAGALSGEDSVKRGASWTELDVAPRWHISEPIALHLAYSLRRSNSTGDQLVGGGVSYSTLATYAGTGPVPFEMRFTHLEAIRGDAGRPKFFRDQLEVRIYYRLR